jgi:recombinase
VAVVRATGLHERGGPDGKKMIVPDPEMAPIIARMFERYGTGKYSLKEIAKLARADGLVYRKSGNPVPNSTIHKILRKRTYTGDYDYNGITYTGSYALLRPESHRVPVAAMPPDARHRSPPGGEQGLHRGGIKLLELAQRAQAVRKSASERKAETPRFCTFELPLEGWAP